MNSIELNKIIINSYAEDRIMDLVNKSQIDATNMDDSTDNSYRQRVI